MVRYLLWALLGVGTATGCVPFYQPMLATAPVVQHRGQLAVAGSWHLFETGQVAAAWSPVEHLRLGAALSACRSGEATDSTASYLRNRQYEVGVGYYFTLGKGRTRVEIAGSFGQGRTFAHGTTTPGLPGFIVPVGGASGGTAVRRGLPEQLGRFTTIAGQGSATWAAPGAGIGALGLVLRLSHVRFAHLTLDGQNRGQPAMWYLEPAWVVRTKEKAVRLEAQVGYSVALASPPENSVFYAARPRLGVGLVVQPGRLRNRL